MSDDSLLSPYGDEPQVQTETCDPASRSCCTATRIVRGAVAFLVIGTAGVYGAITAKPEVAEYFSFLPGMSNGQCPIAAAFGGSSCSSSCSATSSSSTSACSATAATSADSGCPATSACSLASRAAMLEACSQINVPGSGDAAAEVVLADTVFDVDTAPQAKVE